MPNFSNEIKPMQLYLHNIHIDDFVLVPVKFFILRKKPLKKFNYLLNLKCDLVIYADCHASSLIPTSIFLSFPYWFRKLFTRLEVYIWLNLNHVDTKNYDVVYGKALRRGKSVYTFSYRVLLDEAELSRKELEAFSHVYVNLNHYMVRTHEKSINAKKMNNITFLGESNFFQNSKFFQNFFSWYKKDVLVVPYAAQSRFKDFNRFEDRLNKCVATGTFHDLTTEPNTSFYQDFMSFFSENTYQPMRREIFKNKDINQSILESKISQFNEKINSKSKLRFSSLFYKQKTYFEFNIVDLYNSYKMVVVPEELHGMPGISFAEAMMCGCLYIGLDDAMYTGLGMKPGVHYLTYNGSYDDLIRVISMAIQKQDYSKKIAQEGHQFARQNFSDISVSSKLMRLLERC